MKKLTLLSFVLFFAGAALLVSCSKSSDSTTTTGPSIHLLAGTGLVSGNVTVKSGDALSFGISATSGAGKLTHFMVQTTFQNKTSTVYDSTFKTATYNVTLDGKSQGTAGAETWIFTIFDENNNNSNVTITVTTTAEITYGPITAYTNTILGSWNNSTYGSSFASSNGTVYKIVDAKSNSQLIDWLYYFGTVNQATIAAPNDNNAASVFNGANGLSNWTYRNATKFRKVTDVINWNSITNDSLILIQTQSGVDMSAIPSLSVNDVLAFYTNAGKKGLMKITDITTGNDGTITYDVKVQKTGK